MKRSIAASLIIAALFIRPGGANTGQDAQMATQKVGASASAPVGSADKLSFTGSFVYNVPIDIPPGIGGVQPALALSYNSDGGNTWVGVGWDLSLGSIQRSTKSGAPKYDDSKDVFVYAGGGTQVELVSADGGIVNYRPKIEGSFQKFVREGSGWTVYDKSGMKLYFGPTDWSRTGRSSSEIFQWALDRVVDRNGNWFSINYTTDNGTLYPDTILYTGHDSTGKVHRRVKFNLVDRIDRSFSYRSGFRQEMNKQLASIETSVNPSGVAAGPWSLVKRYALGYSIRGDGVRSDLTSIQVTGIDGASSIALPAHQFTYHSVWNGSQLSAQEANSTWQLPNLITYGNRDNGLRFAELNGDGRIDIVRYFTVNGSGSAEAWLNNGNGFMPTSSWQVPVPITVEGNGIWWDGGLRFVDLNGDGLTDILQGLMYHEIQDIRQAWINTGSGFVSSPTWIVPNAGFNFTVTAVRSGVELFRDNGVNLIDVNGDGLPDLVQSLVIDGTGEARHVRLNTGNGWESTDSSNWTLPAWTMLVAHDGLTCVPNGVEFVDLNGDGLTDIIQKRKELTTGALDNKQWLNTGSGWKETSAWDPQEFLLYQFSTKPVDNGIRFADMNGDGLADLVQSIKQINPTLERKIMRVNLGYGWGPEIPCNFPAYFAENDLGNRNTLNTGTALMDINGDGRTDMVKAYSQPGFGVAQKAVSLGTANAELVRRVLSPAGGSVDVTYGVASQDGGHSIPFPVTYLKSLTQSDGRGSSISESYSYQGGLFDPVEREFVGFGRVDGTDAAGVVTSSYFLQVTTDTAGRMAGNPLKGRTYRQEIKNGSTVLARTDTEWEAPIVSANARFARVKTVTQTSFDGGSAQSTRVRYAYDDQAATRLGNVLQTISDGDPAITGDEQTSETEFADPQGGTYLSVPKRERLLGPAGQTLKETQFLYDALPYGQANKGNMTTLRRWLDKPGTGKWVETYAVYNASGQVTRAIDARGAASSVAYDAAGFAVAATNRKNQTTSATFDLRTGAGLTSTDANGVKSSFVYDALGRLTKEIGPNDTATSPSVAYLYHDELLGNPASQYVETQVRERSGQPSVLWSKSYFDGLGRNWRSEREHVGDSVITEFQFDARGLTTGVSVPRKASTGSVLWETTTYDALRRPTRITQPDGTFTQTIYGGRHTDIIDAMGRTNGSDVDAYGRLKSRTEPGVTGTTMYAYDASGNLASVTNARGQTSTFTYDSFGRKLTQNDPNAGSWSYTYDDSGNLASQTDPRGVKLTFAYDSLDRLTSRTLSADPGAVTGSTVGSVLASMAYDETTGRPTSIGRLTSTSDPSGSLAFYHDNLGRVTREVRTVGGVSYETRNTYDAMDRPTSVRYPSDGQLAFTYNDAGAVDRIVNESSTTIAQYGSYDALDRPQSVDLGGGKLKSAYTFDPVKGTMTRAKTDSLATGSAVAFRDISYGFDANRNLTSLGDNLAGTNNQAFGYDTLGRLTSAQGAYGTESYAYDDLGNITTKAARRYFYEDAQRPGVVTRVVASGGAAAEDGSTVLNWGLEPTESIYSVSGSVSNGSGGQSNVSVVLSGPVNLALLSSTAPPAGQFTFRNVAGGLNYAVSVASTGMTGSPGIYAFNPLSGSATSNGFTLMAGTQSVATGGYSDQFSETAPVNPSAHVMDAGPGWTGTDAASGKLKIGAVANKLTCTATSDSHLWVNGTPPTADYTVTARGRLGTGMTSGTRLFLHARWDPASDTEYYVVIKGDQTFYVTYQLNGVDQYDVIAGSTTINPTTDYTWELRVAGGTLTLLKDGVVLGSATDSSITTAGKAGISLRGTTSEIDQWGATWTVASPPPPSGYDDQFVESGAVNPVAHAMNSGPGWTGTDANSGKLKIGAVAHKLTCTATSDSHIWISSSPSTADYSVVARARLGSGMTSATRLFLHARWDPVTDTEYYAVIKGDQTFYVTYQLNGLDQADIIGGSTPIDPNTDYTWELRVVGNSIALLKDGVVVGSGVDSNLAAPGKAGISLRGTQPQVDSFQVAWNVAGSTSAPSPSGIAVVGPAFTTGKVGQALSFNGTSDAFVFPNSAGMASGTFTLMAQIKPVAYPNGYATVLAKSTASTLGSITSGARLLIDSLGKPRFEIGRSTGAVTAAATSALALNQWSFLAASYDGTALKLYVDGVLVATATGAGAITNARLMTAGASLTDQLQLAGGSLFSGAIDEVRVQNRAWSAAEILAAHNLFNDVAVATQTYAYDAAGNCVSKQGGGNTWAYLYDANGQLRRVDKNGAAVATFVYDGFGTRVKKVTPAGTTLYIGDLYEQRPDGSRIDHIPGIGDVVRQGTATSIYYTHADHLGSVQQVTDANGAIVQTSAYKPFGERYLTSGSSYNRLWYTGQEEDSETGLDFYNARYYDPDLGRFTSADPMVEDATDPQSFNRYAYVRNSPSNFVDPSGLWRVSASFHAFLGGHISYDTKSDSWRGGAGFGGGAGGSVGKDNWDVGYSNDKYADIGYDGQLKSGYLEGRYSDGLTGPGGAVVNGYGVSGTYYVNKSEYVVGAGIGSNGFGVNGGYSSFEEGSYSLGGNVLQFGATHDFGTGKWSYSYTVDPKAMKSAYQDSKKDRKYNGYGPEGLEKTFFIFDWLGTVAAGYKASDAHDGGYRDQNAKKIPTDLKLLVNMEKGSLSNISRPNGLLRAGVGIVIAPIYYGAVVIGGGSAFRAGHANGQ